MLSGQLYSAVDPQLIKELNREMEEKGYITVAGKVNRNFFHEKMYCGERKDHAGLQGR